MRWELPPRRHKAGRAGDRRCSQPALPTTPNTQRRAPAQEQHRQRTTGVSGMIRMIVKGTKLRMSRTVRRSACASRGFRVPPAGEDQQRDKGLGGEQWQSQQESSGGSGSSGSPISITGSAAACSAAADHASACHAECLTAHGAPEELASGANVLEQQLDTAHTKQHAVHHLSVALAHLRTEKQAGAG